MFTIENAQIKAVINAKGAELTSLVHKEHQLDYMWQGDPAVWGKHSPVLFPIVGTLKNNTYYHNLQSYQLPRHGFARDKQFAVEDHTGDTITFLLRNDAETLTIFPFAFEFRIRYTLFQNSLAVTYEVVNCGKETMYFSVGAHPAFKIPLVPGTTYTDYYLQFNQSETAPRWPISPDGLIEQSPIPLLQATNRLNLSKDLFQKDALVLKGMSSTIVTLASDKTGHGFRFDYPGFPFLGIWAAKNADFVCIEPWCGIADSVATNQQLPGKEGINKLEPGGSFTRTWTITLF
ncbi:aldose 1-epimerase family protein [Niastella caeni]|uniref:Aldose 1-epimerase family protein n=1 Tax=Niastella caeni TaxID=2569763 RepID=A0A4S8HVP1_9BACT|nr:aldose 1-epimerase family protein [Niastella caeni]THU39475.1 aldose 1-epimerase family protein [Niastella caeni]